jgi:integrase
MARPKGRTHVSLERDRKRLRWYDANGDRNQKHIDNYDSLTDEQVENLRMAWEITLNSRNISVFGGVLIPAMMTMDQLWAKYEQQEIGNLRSGGQVNYTINWRNYIGPKWGKTLIGDIDAMEVEEWLRDLKSRGTFNRKNNTWRGTGNLLARETKAKLRCVMSAMFTYAIRAKLIGSNPISCGGVDLGRGGTRGQGVGVRLLGKFAPARRSVIFTPAEIVEIMGELGFRDRALILLDGVLGIRRGELGGLRWENCDFAQDVFRITSSYDWRNGESNATKTRSSDRTLPMHPVLKDALLAWRGRTPYTKPTDYVFASTRLRGSKPIDLKSVFTKTIKPVIIRLRLAQPDDHFGWHAMRHSVGTSLYSLTKDVITVRDYIGHSRSASVTDLYMHGVREEIIKGQNRMVEAMNLKPLPRKPNLRQLPSPMTLATAEAD